MQFLGIGQAPILRAREIESFAEIQRFRPVHAAVLVVGLAKVSVKAPVAAVALHPGQTGGGVGDGAVAVVAKGVAAVIGIAAHEAGVPSASLRTTVLRIALDPAISQIDPEKSRVAHGIAPIRRCGDVLGIDIATAGREFEGEGIGVDERNGIARGFAGRRIAAALVAAEIDQRIKFLDAGHTPVWVSAGVGLARIIRRLSERHVARKTLLPHQAGDKIGDRIVAVVFVAWRVDHIIGILAEKLVALIGAGPHLAGAAGAEAFDLICIDHAIGGADRPLGPVRVGCNAQSDAKCRGRENQGSGGKIGKRCAAQTFHYCFLPDVMSRTAMVPQPQKPHNMRLR